MRKVNSKDCDSIKLGNRIKRIVVLRLSWFGFVGFELFGKLLN